MNLLPGFLLELGTCTSHWLCDFSTLVSKGVPNPTQSDQSSGPSSPSHHQLFCTLRARARAATPHWVRPALQTLPRVLSVQDSDGPGGTTRAACLSPSASPRSHPSSLVTSLMPLTLFHRVILPPSTRYIISCHSFKTLPRCPILQRKSLKHPTMVPKTSTFSSLWLSGLTSFSFITLFPTLRVPSQPFRRSPRPGASCPSQPLCVEAPSPCLSRHLLLILGSLNTHSTRSFSPEPPWVSSPQKSWARNQCLSGLMFIAPLLPVP